MTNRGAEEIEEFFSGFMGAVRPLLLLDYDGTLAPFRVDRFKARPWAGIGELLNLIQKQGRTQIVVVTGRPATEIVPLLGVEPAPEVWGLHGAERLHTDGRRELDEPSVETQHRLEELREQLRRDAFGGLLEEKPNAVAMHWRGVAAQRAKVIETKTRVLFEPLAQTDGLSLLEFEAGLELRTGRDKGGAVDTLLRASADGVPHPAAYLGDDITDERAFAAIRGRGLGVLVRRERRKTAATAWLRPPEELKEFLIRWLRACWRLEPARPPASADFRDNRCGEA